jgi:leader peptidase (prepilin peptidase)/N-methyltransferase
MADIVPLLLAAICGWVVGILANYLADVLPRRRRLARPICLSCDEIQDWQNYLFWPRRCSKCGEKRRIRVAVVEILLGAAGMWLWSSGYTGWQLVANLVLLAYMGLVAVVDIEHRLILHSISLAGGVLGILYGTWLHGLGRTLLGGAIGFVLMLGLYLLGFVFIKVRAKRRREQPPEDALGFGDVNLSGVAGLLLGYPGVLAGLVLTIIIAGAFSLGYLLLALLRRRYEANLAIPYGPFIVASTVWLLYFRASLGAVLN